MIDSYDSDCIDGNPMYQCHGCIARPAETSSPPGISRGAAARQERVDREGPRRTADRHQEVDETRGFPRRRRPREAVRPARYSARLTPTDPNQISASPIPALASRPSQPVTSVPVLSIRPEEGLGRKRDRAGHLELQQSIARFGVLTPVTVRRAPDGSGDYLLIKGQGRTLACRVLGIESIPAIVVDDTYADNEKVQQFLVENVARLKMRPVDRALLIARARQQGEETAAVAKRFGVSAATVRRLEAQLEGASKREVAALRDGSVNLTMHAVIARYVDSKERADVVKIVTESKITTKELQALFTALDWQALTKLGRKSRHDRNSLLIWACTELSKLPTGSPKDRLRQIAMNLPVSFDAGFATQDLKVAR